MITGVAAADHHDFCALWESPMVGWPVRMPHARVLLCRVFVHCRHNKEYRRDRSWQSGPAWARTGESTAQRGGLPRLVAAQRGRRSGLWWTIRWVFYRPTSCGGVSHAAVGVRDCGGGVFLWWEEPGPGPEMAS